jgi:ABC-type multidrug transport system fused ATPase/permease subunit
MVVLAMLVAGFLQHESTLPSDDAQYLSMKQELSANPEQQDLRRQFRDISTQQRDDYFNSQRWSRRGAILLACGLVVTMVLWQWILAQCRGERQSQLSAAFTTQHYQKSWAQLACIGLLLLLILATSIWIVVSPRVRFDATIRLEPSNRHDVIIEATRFAESTIAHGREVYKWE